MRTWAHLKPGRYDVRSKYYDTRQAEAVKPLVDAYTGHWHESSVLTWIDSNEEITKRLEEQKQKRKEQGAHVRECTDFIESLKDVSMADLLGFYYS